MFFADNLPEFDHEFNAALKSFMEGCNKIKHDANLHWPTVVAVRSGKGKYLAIDNVEYNEEDVERKNPRKSSVFCFVALVDSNTRSLGVVKRGDVLKPATFKSPAKHARGNIFDAHNGLMGSDGKTSMRWTGPHYVK